MLVDVRSLMSALSRASAALAHAGGADGGGAPGAADGGGAPFSSGMHHRVGLAALLHSLPCSRAALFVSPAVDAPADDARAGAAPRDVAERTATAAAAPRSVAEVELAALRGGEYELALADVGISGAQVGGWSALIDGHAPSGDEIGALAAAAQAPAGAGARVGACLSMAAAAATTTAAALDAAADPAPELDVCAVRLLSLIHI